MSNLPNLRHLFFRLERDDHFWTSFFSHNIRKDEVGSAVLRNVHTFGWEAIGLSPREARKLESDYDTDDTHDTELTDKEDDDDPLVWLLRGCSSLRQVILDVRDSNYAFDYKAYHLKRELAFRTSQSRGVRLRLIGAEFATWARLFDGEEDEEPWSDEEVGDEVAEEQIEELNLESTYWDVDRDRMVENMMLCCIWRFTKLRILRVSYRGDFRIETASEEEITTMVNFVKELAIECPLLYMVGFYHDGVPATEWGIWRRDALEFEPEIKGKSVRYDGEDEDIAMIAQLGDGHLEMLEEEADIWEEVLEELRDGDEEN